MNRNNRERVEVKQTKRLVKHEFDSSDYERAGKQLGDLCNDLVDLEKAKSRATADLGARIKGKKLDIDSLSATIREGYEMREVDCTEHLDTPEPGKKTILRTDTGETVGIEAMTDADRQRELEVA